MKQFAENIQRTKETKNGQIYTLSTSINKLKEVELNLKNIYSLINYGFFLEEELKKGSGKWVKIGRATG